MSSIFDLNSNSSDSEDDCDYVPPAGEISEESEEEKYVSDDELSTKKPPKRKRGKRRESEAKQELQKPLGETPVSAESEKQRAEDLWKSFLSDVGTIKPKQSSSELTCDSILQSSDAASTSKSSTGSTSKSSTGSTSIDETDISKRVNDFDSQKVNRKKETITEQYDFAGETVVVTREVDVLTDEFKPRSELSTDESNVSTNDNSSENVINNPSPLASKRKGGLNSVIGTILNKKQKMTTLQKSLHDWNTFKKSEGIQEDLEKYNKGKGGYLERQAFLMRSDQRSFELEKSVRLSKVRK